MNPTAWACFVALLFFTGESELRGKEYLAPVAGNFELRMEADTASVDLHFSCTKESAKCALLQVRSDAIQLRRIGSGSDLLLKESAGPGTGPWKLRLLKKGNLFRYRVNDREGWIREPLGPWETSHPTANSEPANSTLRVRLPDQARITTLRLTKLPWLEEAGQPIITAGPDGTFKEGHVLVGGVLEHKGTYYMYFSGSRFGCDEGGGAREIGVAYSKDLIRWEVHPEPLITLGSKESWEPTGLYCSGVTKTPDGKIAVMYAAQKFPLWGGFGLATADEPLGPFRKHEGNPVYRFGSHAHEFDLVDTGRPSRRYILFFSGFTDKPRTGKPGDRGYLLYSEDLVHWTEEASNPVFGPETLDNWDAIHVRPRGLNRIGYDWYLWYEGCNHWNPPTKVGDGTSVSGWWDSVGLARSKNLIDWEYYPRNPALPGLGVSKHQFDAGWVGWPRMFIKDGTGYVFYTGGRHIGMRTIDIRKLTDWTGEGEQETDLLSPDKSSRR